jgi:hypothetical protein
MDKLPVEKIRVSGRNEESTSELKATLFPLSQKLVRGKGHEPASPQKEQAHFKL